VKAAGEILRGRKGRPIVKYRDTVVSCAKTAEPIEMPFGFWARMGPMNHVLDGGRLPVFMTLVLNAWFVLPLELLLFPFSDYLMPATPSSLCQQLLAFASGTAHEAVSSSILVIMSYPVFVLGVSLTFQ